MSPGRMPPGRLMAQREYARLLEPLLAQAGRYSRSMLRTRADAEDAVQQAALRGLERIHTYDAARPFKGWWFAILHNCCIDTLRRLKSARTDSLEGYDPPDTSPRDDSDSQELSLAMQHLSSEHSPGHGHVASAPGAQSPASADAHGEGMKPVEPAELSAYLDGELEPARAREVQQALEHEPSLRAEFETLNRLDGAWRAAAGSAAFQPRVRLPRGAAASPTLLAGASAIAVLVALRVIPKLTDALGLGLLLHGIALSLILAWLVRLSRQDAVN